MSPVPTMRMLPLLDDAPLALPRAPSLVVVSISGGKDSTAALIEALETFGPGAVVAHHQIILEDWLQTPDYCQAVCDYLGVPLYLSQGVYNWFLCLQCGHRHLSLFDEEAYCHKCGSHDKQFLGTIESIHDLIRARGKWMDARVRACTGHFKVEVFNTWARANASLLGRHPVMVLGERHLESHGRLKLPELRYRDLRRGWMLEWRPILQYRRIDAFRASRQYGIEPHPCYKLQWRGILRRQHRRWLQDGTPPRASYPGQWEGLDQVEDLSHLALDTMIDTLMYEVAGEEGGPRCSCRDCFFKPGEEMRATYDTDQGKALLDESMAIERAIGFTMKYGRSLESIVGDKKPEA